MVVAEDSKVYSAKMILSYTQSEDNYYQCHITQMGREKEEGLLLGSIVMMDIDNPHETVKKFKDLMETMFKDCMKKMGVGVVKLGDVGTYGTA